MGWERLRGDAGGTVGIADFLGALLNRELRGGVKEVYLFCVETGEVIVCLCGDGTEAGN